MGTKIVGQGTGSDIPGRKESVMFLLSLILEFKNRSVLVYVAVI